MRLISGIAIGAATFGCIAFGGCAKQAVEESPVVLSFSFPGPSIDGPHFEIVRAMENNWSIPRDRAWFEKRAVKKSSFYRLMLVKNWHPHEGWSYVFQVREANPEFKFIESGSNEFAVLVNGIKRLTVSIDEIQEAKELPNGAKWDRVSTTKLSVTEDRTTLGWDSMNQPPRKAATP